jgi:hypothetical protein
MSAVATRVPRQPITFVYGNLVWGPFSDEVWAVYSVRDACALHETRQPRSWAVCATARLRFQCI